MGGFNKSHTNFFNYDNNCFNPLTLMT